MFRCAREYVQTCAFNLKFYTIPCIYLMRKNQLRTLWHRYCRGFKKFNKNRELWWCLAEALMKNLHLFHVYTLVFSVRRNFQIKAIFYIYSIYSVAAPTKNHYQIWMENNMYCVAVHFISSKAAFLSNYSVSIFLKKIIKSTGDV